MSIRTDLYSHLSGYAGLTALVGKRIYPLVKPLTTKLPCVVFQVISYTRTYSHGGFSNLARARIQISVFAENVDGQPGYDSVEMISTQVKAAMEVWKDSYPNVQAVFLVNEVDIYESSTDVFHAPLDYIVDYAG